MKLETYRSPEGKWGILCDSKPDLVISLAESESGAIMKALVIYPGAVVHSTGSPEHFSHDEVMAAVVYPRTRCIPLYQAIARTFGAWLRCASDEANESQQTWEPKHRDRIEDLVKQHLPSGSGIDTGTKFDFHASGPERLVFTFGFHHMNEGGMYDGWTEHTAVVTPSLRWGWELKITGRDRNQIKDYLADVYRFALEQEVPEFAPAHRTAPGVNLGD